jgi:outer membrane protein TolC
MRPRQYKYSRSLGLWPLLLIALLCVAGAAAEDVTPAALPQPLTLEYALSLADETHPELAIARSELDRARAGQLEAQARTDARLFAEVTGEYADPSLPPSESWVNDSRARLLLSKPLYDFGRSRAAERAAEGELAGRALRYLDARASRRLDIMARFFDVLLADLRYAADTEEMALRYVQFDRQRDRASLGQVSEVDLAEHENRYQEALIQRTAAQKRQAATRQQLAIALNRPATLPAALAEPAFPQRDREVPDYQALYAQVQQGNPVLGAARAEYEAARQTIESERARRRPSLTAELERAEYERNLTSRSDKRAMLNLRIPLYQGSEVDAAVTRAAAEAGAREARLKKLEHELLQQSLDLVQELETLKVREKAAAQRLGFREQYLDRARTLYEMETTADLGDAMVKLAEAQWQAARVRYELALAWARLEALTGKLVNPLQEKTP